MKREKYSIIFNPGFVFARRPQTKKPDWPDAIKLRRNGRKNGYYGFVSGFGRKAEAEERD